MHYDYTQFGSTVINDFDARRSGQFSLSHSTPLKESKALGHPQFERLGVGQKATVSIATLFLDLSQFTRRTFWDPSDEVADLAHAIMTGFIEAVTRFGGFALGLRGDGLFAGFGPGASQTDVACALGASAFCLRGVRDEINPLLQSRGVYPVQARAGADFGQVTFVRSGSESNSEVNIIGFAANFAAKCEKTANAWEVVIGEKAAEALDRADLCTHHTDSPKRFRRGPETRAYKFYDYGWEKTLDVLPGVLRDLAGNPTTAIRLGQ